jgi:hypothetical protein
MIADQQVVLHGSGRDDIRLRDRTGGENQDGDVECPFGDKGSVVLSGSAWNASTGFFFFFMAMAVLSFIPRYTASKTSDRVYSCV